MSCRRVADEISEVQLSAYQVLSRLALLQEAADNVPRVYGAAEQGLESDGYTTWYKGHFGSGRDLILVQDRKAERC